MASSYYGIFGKLTLRIIGYQLQESVVSFDRGGQGQAARTRLPRRGGWLQSSLMNLAPFDGRSDSK